MTLTLLAVLEPNSALVSFYVILRDREGDNVAYNLV